MSMYLHFFGSLRGPKASFSVDLNEVEALYVMVLLSMSCLFVNFACFTVIYAVFVILSMFFQSYHGLGFNRVSIIPKYPLE